MTNKLDKHYIALLEEILEYGTKKQTRNGEVLSLFGKQIRHSMKNGFPLLTTKKMFWKGIVTELMWFLQGRTDLKWLLEHNNTIWLGDAIKNYEKHNGEINWGPFVTKEEAFIDKIKTDDEFAKKWGDLGRVYGVQWRKWQGWIKYKNDDGTTTGFGSIWHDQIANLISELKTNPDSRRMIVSAWNVADLDKCVLPPCHNFWQVYSVEKNGKRYLSMMVNIRSNDIPLGLPFNIASYGLLLEIIAKLVNMVPDELIINIGDAHIYLNQIEGCKEQIGREFTLPERMELWEQMSDRDVMDFPIGPLTDEQYHDVLDKIGVAKRTREPFPLPKLNINTEWWPTEGGECGVGPIDAQAVLRSFSNESFCKCLMEEDIQLIKYKSHPKITMPLSN